MPTLTMAEMISYARGAGFSGSDAIIAGAVGMAESSGNTHAINFVPCVGIWQINVKAHSQYTINNMYDPRQNAQAAYAIFKSQGWAAWSTYTSGAYKRYMAAATKAAGSASADITGIGGPVNPITVGSNLGTIINTVNALQDPATWRRTLLVIVGIVMIVMGLILMTATPKNIKAAVKIAEVVK